MNKMPLTGDRLLCSEKKRQRKSTLASRTYYSRKVKTTLTELPVFLHIFLLSPQLANVPFFLHLIHPLLVLFFIKTCVKTNALYNNAKV